ncbi:MAG: outer membrane protein transport protein [Pseudomonadota bacterium]
MKTRNFSRLAAGTAFCALFAAPQLAEAGAFQLNERSTSSQGMSFADSVSGAKDPTYAGFNPAALSKIESFAIGGNLSFIGPISDGETRRAVLNGVEVPVSSLPATVETSTNADRSGIVPASAIGYRINEEVVLGFSLKSPFGLSTENPDNFIGAADGIASSLITVEASPAISYQVNDRLAFGGSVNVLFLDARLTNSALILDGQDIQFGFSLGALWEPIDGTQIGLAYHHGYEFDVAADAAFTSLAPAPLNGVAGVVFDSSVSANLPATIQFGVTQEITDDIRVSAEVRGIFWSAFDAIDTSIPDLGFEASDPQNYEDAFFVAVGGEYDVTEDLTLRGGLAYDDSPTIDSTATVEGRTVRVPDANRLWVSTGGSYDMEMFGQDITVDAAYSYLFALENPEVEIRSGPFAGSIVEYDGGAHIFSIGGSIRF